jgi:hypothetical protein
MCSKTMYISESIPHLKILSSLENLLQVRLKNSGMNVVLGNILMFIQNF